MFSNEQIEIVDLPKLEDLQMTPIHPNYLYVLLLNILTSYGFGIIGLIIAHRATSDDNFKVVSVYLISTLVLLMLLSAFIYYLGFKKRVYAMREKDICYSHGYIVTKTISLPYNRIQHIEITRSFLARKLNLSSLKIYSAGESGGDLIIHGLPKEVAETQYAFLTKVINERL